MTAEMIFQKFQELFPELTGNVRKYNRQTVDTITLTLQNGAICTFTYQKRGNTANFSLIGRKYDASSKLEAR